MHDHRIDQPADHARPHESVYDGLLGGDDRQWAFGTSFEDPLAGVDTTIPAGIDPADLAAYCLMLGDDALVYSHRLSEWASNAPDLEDDIALANIALDLLGQARLLLARAAAADPGSVPIPAAGLTGVSPVPAEDALAYFRDEADFRNVRFVEPENGDFAVTVTRLLVFSCYRYAVLQHLTSSVDPVLAAIARKGVKEVAYHRDYAGRWFVVLAGGTQESRRRVLDGIALVWRHHDELFDTHPIERRAQQLGFGVDPAGIAAEVDTVLEQVFAVAAVDRPDVAQAGEVAGGSGRDGRHTEQLGRLLAEMQSVARAHPLGRW